LDKVSFWDYTFKKSQPGEYIIRLEMCDTNEEYLSLIKESGAEYLGRIGNWHYYCKRKELGPFNIYSDLDSKINHLDRIAKFLMIIAYLNIGAGFLNSVVLSGLGWVNLFFAVPLIYGLGRMHGKKEELLKERQVHE